MHLKNCQLNSVLFKKSQIELFYPTDLVIIKTNYPLEDHYIDIYLDFVSWGLLSFIRLLPDID